MTSSQPLYSIPASPISRPVSILSYSLQSVLTLNACSFGEMSNDLGRTMYEYQFRIPPYYTLLVRSLSVLEVSCSWL